MRVHDVGLGGATDAACELEVAQPAAGAPVEHRKVDIVPTLAERELHLPHEDTEVGIVRSRIHLRDEQDAHGRSLTQRPRPALSQPTRILYVLGGERR